LSRAGLTAPMIPGRREQRRECEPPTEPRRRSPRCKHPPRNHQRVLSPVASPWRPTQTQQKHPLNQSTSSPCPSSSLPCLPSVQTQRIPPATLFQVRSPGATTPCLTSLSTPSQVRLTRPLLHRPFPGFLRPSLRSVRVPDLWFPRRSESDRCLPTAGAVSSTRSCWIMTSQAATHTKLYTKWSTLNSSRG
jgi:hypothetical protein